MARVSMARIAMATEGERPGPADAGNGVPDLLCGSCVEAPLALLAGVIGLIIAIFATQSAASLLTDEASGIAETGLAVALSRTTCALSVAIPVTWGSMGALWFATMLGEVFGLPTWPLDALPFSAVPSIPLDAMF